MRILPKFFELDGFRPVSRRTPGHPYPHIIVFLSCSTEPGHDEFTIVHPGNGGGVTLFKSLCLIVNKISNGAFLFSLGFLYMYTRRILTAMQDHRNTQENQQRYNERRYPVPGVYFWSCSHLIG